MKRLFCLIFAALFCLGGARVAATEQGGFYPPAYGAFEEWTAEAGAFTGSLECKAALLMEADTGTVLYKSCETERLPIASVTKIMSTLLVAEALDKGKIAIDELVTISAYAASMGGSQVYLEPGEQMSVDELLKCLIVVSANDAAVALAEHIYGSADSFVNAMNLRAAELGMENSRFVNTTGLDDGGYCSAEDVAIMTRELLKHPVVFNYTTIWMDTVRDGAFGLSNTNRLVRFYKGANGMKTGFTSEAMYCLSATAERDGMQLIAVVLGAPSSDVRFGAAKSLLDYGFANYRVLRPEAEELSPIAVKGGTAESVPVEYSPPTVLGEKGSEAMRVEYSREQSLKAPVAKGQKVGEAVYYLGDEECARTDLCAAEAVDTMSYAALLARVWKNILSFV